MGNKSKEAELAQRVSRRIDEDYAKLKERELAELREAGKILAENIPPTSSSLVTPYIAVIGTLLVTP